MTQTVPATVVASSKKNTTETTGAKVTDIETTATLQAKQETKDEKSRKIGVSLTVAGIVCILAVGGYTVKNTAPANNSRSSEQRGLLALNGPKEVWI